jgi:hypothetical protein
MVQLNEKNVSFWHDRIQYNKIDFYINIFKQLFNMMKNLMIID